MPYRGRTETRGLPSLFRISDNIEELARDDSEFELIMSNRHLLIALLLALVAAVVVFSIGSRVGRGFSTPSESAKSSYSKQIQSLDNAKSALGSLATYIDQQKKQLELSASSLAMLRDEENKMHPLIEADKKVIDAMFAVQEQRNQKAQITERWIGFALGVLASLMASLIYGLIFAKRRPTPGRLR